MTFKKIGSLLLGALMVVGFSSAVSAQTQTILQDGEGVRLRVTNPDNGGFAGIGKEVEVEVHYLTLIKPTDIRVAIVRDTMGIMASEFGDLTLNNDQLFDGEPSFENDFFKRATTFTGGLDSLKILDVGGTDGFSEDEDDVSERVSGEASFSKIVFKFEVLARSNASISTATLFAVAVVRNAGSVTPNENGEMFNNLHTTDVPTIASNPDGTIFGFVGDGVQFGIDANRPTGVIMNVFIDANVGPYSPGAKKSQIFNPGGWETGIVDITTDDIDQIVTVDDFDDLAAVINGTGGLLPGGLMLAGNGRLETDDDPPAALFPEPLTAINIGDDLTVSFQLVGAPPSGATGVVYIVDSEGLLAAEALAEGPGFDFADSSFVTFNFTFFELLGGTIRDSITVDSRLIDASAVGNNRRITAAAFLRDQAGNLSAAEANADLPKAEKDPNIHVLDLTPATISPVRPKTAAGDSSRFTALIETAGEGISIVNLTDGTRSSNVEFDLNPFEFSVDEGLSDIQVTFVTGGDEISLSCTGGNNAGDLDNNVIRILGLNPDRIAGADDERSWTRRYNEVGDGVPDAAVRFDLTSLIIDPDADPDMDPDPDRWIRRVSSAKLNQQGGHNGSWTVTVVDSAGNVTNDTQTDIWFDGVAPDTMDANYFPTEAGAPKDQDTDVPTITSETSAVVLRSVRGIGLPGVQYVENTGVSPTTSIIRVSPGDVNLAITDRPITLTLSDSLITGEEYKLQVFQRDLAGNVSMTAAQTLLYDNEFPNPEASEFKIVQDNKDVVAGQSMTITVVALDGTMTADTGSEVVDVTHRTEAFIRIEEVASAKKAAHITYTFDGNGVTDNEDGTATLDNSGWDLGKREVDIVSTGIIEDFIVIVEDKTGDDVNFDGQTADTLSVEAADFRAFAVKVLEDGVETDGVSGEFTVWVHPTDIHGNPSAKVMKAKDGMNPVEADSLKLLAANIDPANVLAETFVEFSVNAGDAEVPKGPQTLPGGGDILHRHCSRPRR